MTDDPGHKTRRRDITGETPSEWRAREQAAPHAREQVPGCFLSAAQRPDLTVAVSEKRRREAGAAKDARPTAPAAQSSQEPARGRFGLVGAR